MSIGIDKIGFATSQYVLNMADLALARGAEPEKFSKGLMLDATSIFLACIPEIQSGRRHIHHR